MNVLKIILIVLLFACLVAGIFLACFGKMFVSQKKNTSDSAHRKQLRIKLIGYVLMMLSLVFAIFQSMI